MIPPYCCNPALRMRYQVIRTVSNEYLMYQKKIMLGLALLTTTLSSYAASPLDFVIDSASQILIKSGADPRWVNEGRKAAYRVTSDEEVKSEASTGQGDSTEQRNGELPPSFPEAHPSVEARPLQSPKGSCPIIQPAPLTMVDDAISAYEHYISPWRRTVKIGRALLIPTDVKGKKKLLNEIYDSYQMATRNNMVGLISLVDGVRQAYERQASFAGLNTSTAMTLAGVRRNDEQYRILGQTAICAEALPENNAFFVVHFYGVKKSNCEKMISSVTWLAKGVRVNQIDGPTCTEDHHGGQGRKFWHLWSSYGRNQVSLIFSKHMHN